MQDYRPRMNPNFGGEVIGTPVTPSLQRQESQENNDDVPPPSYAEVISQTVSQAQPGIQQSNAYRPPVLLPDQDRPPQPLPQEQYNRPSVPIPTQQQYYQPPLQPYQGSPSQLYQQPSGQPIYQQPIYQQQTYSPAPQYYQPSYNGFNQGHQQTPLGPQQNNRPSRPPGSSAFPGASGSTYGGRRY